MTTTTTTQSTTPESTTGTPAGDLVRVPAAEVVLEDNIRTAADLDPSFLRSVKRHGVLLPVIGYRNAEGAVIVRDGQMRVLAAREAGIDVPVFLTDRDIAEAKRITEQLVANEQRTALSTSERLVAYRQLELAGLSEAQIARETGTKRETVKNTLTVARSETATAAVTERQLTLDAALLVAEFDGDEDAQAQITEAAESYDDTELPFLAEQIRQDRARQAEAADLAASYAAQGVRVITRDEREGWFRLSQLTATEPSEDSPYGGDPLSEEEHVGCPGRAAYIAADWGTPTATEGCTTPDAHHLRFGSSQTVKKPAAELTEEERETARADRKRLIANNKAWDAADTIRHQWVTSLLQRKTMPKDAAAFVATTVTRFPYMIRNDASYRLRDLLGLDSENQHGLAGVAEWVQANPTKALHVVTAHAISAYEAAADRTWWRTPRAEGQVYLTQLAQWGYPLSVVERIAAGQPEDDPAETE